MIFSAKWQIFRNKTNRSSNNETKTYKKSPLRHWDMLLMDVIIPSIFKYCFEERKTIKSIQTNATWHYNMQKAKKATINCNLWKSQKANIIDFVQINPLMNTKFCFFLLFLPKYIILHYARHNAYFPSKSKKRNDH